MENLISIFIILLYIHNQEHSTFEDAKNILARSVYVPFDHDIIRAQAPSLASSSLHKTSPSRI